MKAAALMPLLLAVPVLAAPPAWVGLAVTGAQTTFALRPAPPGRSEWLPVGGQAAGWTILAFEAAQGTLVLEGPGGAVASVRLLDRGIGRPPPEAQAVAAALVAVAVRDGWSSGAEAQPPQRAGEGYRVLVRRGTEARMVVVAGDGTVADEWKV